MATDQHKSPGERRLEDPLLWTLFLRRLGSGDVKHDAETIKSFAEMLKISPRRVLDKLRAHLHTDHPTLN
ncbi:MAG: hypothetical protein WAL15_06475 [Xanthobacteraceae bacterium]